MAGSATVQFDVNTAQCMLKDANTHFAAMLPAVDVQPGWDAGESLVWWLGTITVPQSCADHAAVALAARIRALLNG
jgi:hypothetical protein